MPTPIKGIPLQSLIESWVLVVLQSKIRYAIINDAKAVQMVPLNADIQANNMFERACTLMKGALDAALDAVKRHGGSGLLTSSPLVSLALERLASTLLGLAHRTTGAVRRLDTRP
jgi:hypothetical protein